MTDRSQWTVKKYKLGEEPEYDPATLQMTAGQRIELVWELTKPRGSSMTRSSVNRDFAEMLSALSDAGAEFLTHSGTPASRRPFTGGGGGTPPDQPAGTPAFRSL